MWFYRQRLEALLWAMYLIGCTYNLCWPHQQLHATPAMAVGITDHVWSVKEVLSYKVPPTAKGELKRPRGRPRTRPKPDPTVPKRARGRPSKYLLILRRLRHEKAEQLRQGGSQLNHQLMWLYRIDDLEKEAGIPNPHKN